MTQSEVATLSPRGRVRNRRWLAVSVILGLVVALATMIVLDTYLELAWFDILPVPDARTILGPILPYIPHLDLTHLLATYGYWAVLGCVAVESMGVPFPGETMLLAAAIYAGTAHGTSAHLSIALVIAAAASGAILGDNLGFLIGRQGGYRLLRRYGRYLRLDERRLKLGQYLFQKHGGKTVFFGRFVAVLRIWAAFLAGTARMPWGRFLCYNAAGGIVWATVFGLGGYLLGTNIHKLGGPFSILTGGLVVIAMGAGLLFLRRNEHRLHAEAERALPGPLDAYQTRGASGTPHA